MTYGCLGWSLSSKGWWGKMNLMCLSPPERANHCLIVYVTRKFTAVHSPPARAPPVFITPNREPTCSGQRSWGSSRPPPACSAALNAAMEASETAAAVPLTAAAGRWEIRCEAKRDSARYNI